MTTPNSSDDDQPQPGERVFYIRDARGQPVACLAYHADEGTATVAYAVSALHPNDTFDRRMARRIALGRLRVRPTEVRIGPSERPLGAALAWVVEDMSVPSRVRRILLAAMRARSDAAVTS